MRILIFIPINLYWKRSNQRRKHNFRSLQRFRWFQTELVETTPLIAIFIFSFSLSTWIAVNLILINLDQTDTFWGTLARSRLTWIRDFDRVSDCDMESGRFSWFSGGKINVSGKTEFQLVSLPYTPPPSCFKEKLILIDFLSFPKKEEKKTHKTWNDFQSELIDISCYGFKKYDIRKLDNWILGTVIKTGHNSNEMLEYKLMI